MTRAYARAPCGQRAVASVPKNWGETTTVLAALSTRGILAPMVRNCAMNTPAFEAYVEQCLGPELRPGDIVIMDNLRAHKSAHACALIEARGAFVVFLPPYSPDLNPIEEAWSKFKAIFAALAVRVKGDVLDAVAIALRAITPSDAQGWITHAGYSAP